MSADCDSFASDNPLQNEPVLLDPSTPLATQVPLSSLDQESTPPRSDEQPRASSPDLVESDSDSDDNHESIFSPQPAVAEQLLVSSSPRVEPIEEIPRPSSVESNVSDSVQPFDLESHLKTISFSFTQGNIPSEMMMWSSDTDEQYFNFFKSGRCFCVPTQRFVSKEQVRPIRALIFSAVSLERLKTVDTWYIFLPKHPAMDDFCVSL